MTPLVERVKKRKLVQWTLAYLAGAWLVFEVVDTVGGRWNLPDSILRGISILLGVGLVVALVLAWYHGEKGQQRVSGPELVMIAALLVVAGVAVSQVKSEGPSSPGAPGIVGVREGDDRPSIAVLMCANMSPDPADAHLAEGLHEEILLKLQKISALFSIGRTSVLQYAVDPPSVTEIATRLRVGYVGECSVRKQAERIRLTFQLLDGKTGGQVWAENYDTTLTASNLFEIQSDIARQIAQAMNAVLSPEEVARIQTKSTENLEAYNSYLLGRFWWNQRTPDGIAKAIELFEKAIGQDDRFALAYVGLADSYMVAPFYSDRIPLAVAFPNARAAVERALVIDDRLGEAHASRAAVAMYFQWDWAEAEREFQRAIDLAPRYAMAHQWLALLYLYTHRFSEGIDRLRFALTLDPLYPNIYYNLGDALSHAGHDDAAIEQLEQALALFPDFGPATAALARVYVRVGRFEDAIALAPSSAYVTRAYRELGRESEARALAERIERTGSPRERIASRTGVGDVDGAFEIISEALSERAPWVVLEPNVITYYESLHDDPRWDDYLRRIGVSR